MSDFDLDSERQARFTNVIDIRNGKIHKEFNKKNLIDQLILYIYNITMTPMSNLCLKNNRNYDNYPSF